MPARSATGGEDGDRCHGGGGEGIENKRGACSIAQNQSGTGTETARLEGVRREGEEKRTPQSIHEHGDREALEEETR